MTTHLTDIQAEVRPGIRAEPSTESGTGSLTEERAGSGTEARTARRTGSPDAERGDIGAGTDPRADDVTNSSTRLVLEHLHAVTPAVESLLRNAGTLAGWGVEMANRLLAGHRLLAAGNGGSAAEAQHLTAELVGRFDGEREPFSAISLHAESSAVTAIANDYGFDRMYARQVTAHGRPGDLLVLLSTSGRSPNLLHAADAARAAGVTTWALTGVGPNPLTECVDDHVAIDAASANAQEGHLIALHAMCRAFDAEVLRRRREEQR